MLVGLAFELSHSLEIVAHPFSSPSSQMETSRTTF